MNKPEKFTYSMEKVKFVSVKRTICPKTQLHYLDAISDDGEYYTAVMSPNKEDWLVYTSQWKKAGQMPYNTPISNQTDDQRTN